ncbi:hypothetical protein [Sorangium sp. So ce388]|uniref:hypothetical protein n=1 Tax=Sorangium sp. So ce388 TaxID=3133309 RepID=UPI003F5C07C2
MSYARYYVIPRSPLQASKLNFTALKPWIQVAIRGVDPGGKAIVTPPLHVQQGRGILDLSVGCVYEIYFSDAIIDQKVLDGLRGAGKFQSPGNGIAFSPSLGGIAQHAEDPPPPPPPGSRPGAPDVPFDTNNVYDLYP